MNFNPQFKNHKPRLPSCSDGEFFNGRLVVEADIEDIWVSGALPTKVSQLENDLDYLKREELSDAINVDDNNIPASSKAVYDAIAAVNSGLLEQIGLLTPSQKEDLRDFISVYSKEEIETNVVNRLNNLSNSIDIMNETFREVLVGFTMEFTSGDWASVDGNYDIEVIGHPYGVNEDLLVAAWKYDSSSEKYTKVNLGCSVKEGAVVLTSRLPFTGRVQLAGKVEQPLIEYLAQEDSYLLDTDGYLTSILG